MGIGGDGARRRPEGIVKAEDLVWWGLALLVGLGLLAVIGDPIAAIRGELATGIRLVWSDGSAAAQEAAAGRWS
jgi:hypothetical protein